MARVTFTRKNDGFRVANQELLKNPYGPQRYTYEVLQTIQMKLILLCVWAKRAVFGSALKFKYEI